MVLLNVQKIEKKFGDFRAVSDVSFNLEGGKIYGLLGPNGAGKTTTIRMIMNILVPDSGSIELFGQKMSDDLKNRLGYLPEERGLYPKMKVLPLLQFFGEMHGLTAAEAKKRAVFWLEKLEISDKSSLKAEELSKGQQQKIQFISAIIHNPELLILDEPFTGLDPVNVNLFKDIILDLKKENRAIIFSTHLMESAEKLCDEVLMINQGRKVLDGPLKTIQQSYGKKTILLEYSGDQQIIEQQEMVSSVNNYGNYAEIILHDNYSSDDFLRKICPVLSVHRFEAARTSLNDIFISIVKGDNHA